MKPTPTIIRKARGFALIVTLMLMSLITLLAVGLLALSSIALRSSRQGSAMVTARANARLAMMLALGDLQKYAGPDQRVTARADILAATDTSKRNWTGVWDVAILAATPDKPISAATSPAITPTWLVSTSGSSTQTNTGAAMGQADIAAGTAVRLIGSGSVDTSVAGNEIIVPLQKVKSTTAGQPGGACAYWVGDEGVKARINLDSPGYRTTATATDASYAFAGSSRPAIEVMERAANPTTGTVTSAWGGPLYPYVAETAPKLITTGQLPLYAGNQAAAKARFHDLTAYSAGVLANTADGGLRQDLTRILSDPAKPGPADSASIFPAVSVSPTPTQTYRLPPTWGRLREWWTHPITPSNNPNDPWNASNDPNPPKLEITPSLATTTTPPIAPVVVWAEVGFAFITEDLSTGTPPGVGYRLRLQVFPRAVLWNPYTVPMAGRSYELGIGSEITGNDPNFTIQNAAGTEICRFYPNRYSFKTSVTSRYLYFKITVPALQPGQTQVLSLATTMGNELTEGDYPGNYTILNASADDWFDTPLQPDRFTIPVGLPTGTNFGGSNNFYLRDTGQSPPGNANSTPTNFFQFSSNPINQPGITGTTSPVSLPPPGTYAPQPHFRAANAPNMDNRNPVRWLDQLNLLAPILVRHPSDGTWGPFYRFGFYSASTEKLPTVSGTDEVSMEMMATGVRATKPTSNINPITGKPYRLVLREPRLPNSGLYQSIAHLQHAPLNDTGIGPTYVAGNSIKSPRIVGTDTSVTGSATSATSPFYDSSYLINQALWDKYFFSTIPTTLTAADLASASYKLPNARLQLLSSADPAKLKQHDTAATKLMVSGGFNINSTSEQAWRAVLGAAYNLKYNPVTGALTSAPTNPSQSTFSRFLKPLGDSADPYRGYRQLNEAQVAALAAKLVAEVKTRGPFRSLADFVNRRLVDTSDLTVPAAATGLKGAVQTAIDTATGTNAAITNPQPFNIFSPGYVTQADVLSRIGSAISARSDTFVIRTYGEAGSNSDTPPTKAYCEVVVQRNPDYVDRSTAPEAMPAAGSINGRFGRRFTIVSFRWLSPDEI